MPRFCCQKGKGLPLVLYSEWSVSCICVSIDVGACLVVRLLSIGLSLLQGDILANTMCKSVLRERVYAATLDYFSVAPTHPTQKGTHLREDIIALVKFWQSMHSDKKYLRSTDIVVRGESLQTMPCSGTVPF